MQFGERQNTMITTEQMRDSTNLYHMGNPNAPINVVASMRDNGEINVLFPVIERLIKNGDYQVSIFADGPGGKLLDCQPGFRKLKIDKNILINVADEISKADLVLVSQSMDSGIDTSLVATAATETETETKPITLAIEDFPGAGSGHDNVLSSKRTLLIPDWQCVMNEESKMALMKARPKFDSKRIIITGLPNFDNLNVNEKLNSANGFRKKYKISESEKIIVWVGGYGKADGDSLKLFIDGLKDSGIRNYRLIIRRHPADKRSKAFFDCVTVGLSEYLLDTANETIDVVRQAADLVVSVFSTESVKSVCEGTTTLLVMIPEILEQSGEENSIFLIAEDGSAAVVRQKMDMVKLLKKTLYDESFKKQMKEKMKSWEVDGKSTDRIEKLINKIFINRHF